ncbi:kinase-like protein [Piromyces finnis]|uniref:cAMP-dependent protein kinase n=1 Tax=Piromyces finnis TaxID=1754191 RepID=A0A1Y1VB25_9FUNG|nr:kinase-like protein [Piromyces finnis]|eukprot:ORX51752.1 kinase-like protein [Piromyces finnis]
MDKVKTNSLCLPFSRLSVVDTLGKGTFGSVQLVKEKTKGGVAALKTIPKESISKYMIEIQKQNDGNTNNDEVCDNNKNKMLGSQALKEITAMKKVCTGQCSGIPRYVGDREDKDNFYILMDSVKGKSLRAIVNEMGPFTDINTIRLILAQILSTISFIHSHSVLHRDLSDNNILIQPNGTVKIIDFGCATVFDPNNIPKCSSFEEYPEVDPDDINKKNIIGTLDFIAPEVLVDNCYSEKSDIWSFGVLLFFMVTGHYPFSDDEIDDYYETMYNILENTVILYDTDEIYDPLYDIFYQCCNPDVYSRITIEELKNHEFFEGIDWNVITLPKNKKKPNLSIHTSLLKNNANATLLANSNNSMGPNQIYVASPTCLNSPIRINSPSCLYTPPLSSFSINMPSSHGKPENSILSSNSIIVNSPLIKTANSPARNSPLVKAATPVTASPKILNSTLLINNKNDYRNETLLFSSSASKLTDMNSYDYLSKSLNSHPFPSSTANVINNITPNKPLVNISKNLMNDEYINSPLHESTLYSSKTKSAKDPFLVNNLKQNSISENNNDYNNSKKKNVFYSDGESRSRNNELFSEAPHNNNINPIEMKKPESSSYQKLKRVNSSESCCCYSDDETKSNCTLTNELEKEAIDPSILMEDNTLILNNGAEANNDESNNSNICKTWDSEYSHILTF